MGREPFKKGSLGEVYVGGEVLGGSQLFSRRPGIYRRKKGIILGGTLVKRFRKNWGGDPFP